MLVAYYMPQSNLSSKRKDVKVVAHGVTKDTRPRPMGKKVTVHALLISVVRAVQMIVSAADNTNEIHITSIIHSLNRVQFNVAPATGDGHCRRNSIENGKRITSRKLFIFGADCNSTEKTCLMG
jgi:hypothetical protein